MAKPMILLALAAVAAAAAQAQQPPAPPGPRFTLICSAQMQKKSFAVDTAQKTIDGKPANFGATAVTWKTGGETAKPGGGKKNGDNQVAPARVVLHELDRIEGTYRSWNEGENGETAVVYGCEKAGPPKF
ncbi:MAG: hypothetical protein HZC24_11175 [Rhodocyclales bacterium]|nr:hypothetical protein [Rhodocyclales bacterium]